MSFTRTVQDISVCSLFVKPEILIRPVYIEGSSRGRLVLQFQNHVNSTTLLYKIVTVSWISIVC